MIRCVTNKMVVVIWGKHAGLINIHTSLVTMDTQNTHPHNAYLNVLTPLFSCVRMCSATVFLGCYVSLVIKYDWKRWTTVFARSVAASTNVFNLSRREATIQERLLFESSVYLFDCALPQELNNYVMVFVNV